ncbi:aspartate--tRNA ligase [Chrysiogenes arsenatis]|uniref:aspartate--tRNA ligase n=1 Tax=Chrysiogenes arsenatis TaxID=309797 RepID=UPI000426D80C|nr:aspartate--tRNA ligase [Chrysiogenes arsenatis]
MEIMQGLLRTHSCGTLTAANIGEQVTLMGWAHRRRDHGGLIFIDLRDRDGLTQIVLDPTVVAEAHTKGEQVRSEFVLAAVGKVRPRPEGTVNEKLKTGEIEVIITELRILNPSKTPPFMIDDYQEVNENVRLKYRYIDLRRPEIQKHIINRHRLTRAMREYLYDKGFLDIETPVLTKSTPEGARDYLVPSRVNPGRFFALPQSPQLFKQLLMISGYDKYFQIVKCFRDEDLRADRQPEFTQLDMEMSFIDREQLMELIEGLFAYLWKQVAGVEIPTPFQRLSYAEVMDRFGCDKPDTRYGLELINLSDLDYSGFQVFRNALDNGGQVKAINGIGCGELSRKDIDDMTKELTVFGAKGLAYIKVKENGEYQSPITKFLGEATLKAIVERCGANVGDCIFFMADTKKVVADSLNRLRSLLAQRLDLIDNSKYNFLWVTEFPLLEYDEDAKRWNAMHHPFTSPMDEDVPLLATDPGACRAKAYDLVLNGFEIGGGSIRIHREEVQSAMFSLLGIGEEEARAKFGFLLDALSFGTPPHGGIAFGVDRVAMILSGTNSIRDVIAFPKTQKATCVLTDAPSLVDDKQLRELHIKTTHIE